MEASRRSSSSFLGRTGTTQRVLLSISSRRCRSLTGKTTGALESGSASCCCGGGGWFSVLSVFSGDGTTGSLCIVFWFFVAALFG